MKMTYETKAGSVGGSTTTVIPSALVNLLNIKKGDKLVWTVEITDKGANINLSPKKEE
jgi:antitoxin component of MazEF toxin-antitoxin module